VALKIPYVYDFITVAQVASKTKSMEQNPSWEGNNISSASQDTPGILWKNNVHYRVHLSSPLTLSWTRQFQSTPSHHISLRSILILLSMYVFWLASLLHVSPPKTCMN
jgi:hypothetical protein